MKASYTTLFLVVLAALIFPLRAAEPQVAAPALATVPAASYKGEKITRTDAEWRKRLTAEQYRICRGKDTERACSGKYWENHETGIYRCVACGLELFVSDTKFESGTGWPSFFQPAAANVVVIEEDRTYGMERKEVKCARCDSHLGHVFDDGPKPTGLRYCMNSVALDFVKATAPKPAEK